MAERTFQFGGGKKFSSLLKVAGEWISSYQSADIFLFPHSLSVQSNQFVITPSMPQTQAWTL